MGGIGGLELVVIGLVALIVVGPRDLPGMFRTLGQFTAKAKRMAREFSQAMESAADEAGVKDVTNTFRDVANPKKMGIDALKKASKLDSLDPESATGKLAKERAELTKKIHENTAKAVKARETAEAEAKAAPKAKAKPAAKAKPKPSAKATAKPEPAAKAKAAAKPKPKTAKPKKADT